MSVIDNDDTRSSSSSETVPPAAAPLFVTSDDDTTLQDTPQFGQSVSLKRPQQQEQEGVSQTLATTKTRNVITAIVAVLVAVLNYAWQYTHPITSLSILQEMQASSQPLSIIGSNDKPTVVDFWAPWCENCKLMAPTLLNVEQLYSDHVNFVMVNGDLASAWPSIEAFRVDAIPHLALVNSDGQVETALIGPIPKSVLQADLDTMIENAHQKDKQALPYQMLDVFRDEPDKRQVHFDP